MADCFMHRFEVRSFVHLWSHTSRPIGMDSSATWGGSLPGSFGGGRRAGSRTCVRAWCRPYYAIAAPAFRIRISHILPGSLSHTTKMVKQYCMGAVLGAPD